MTGVDRRNRWWVGLDEPSAVTEPVNDPWPIDDAEVELSAEQIRFLESLADQPPVPRLTGALHGVDDPGIDPAAETGD